MKKVFSILSYVFAGLTIIGLVGLCIYNKETTPSLWVYDSMFLLLAVGLVLAAILAKKSKIVAMIPMLGIYVVLSLFNRNVEDNLNVIASSFNFEILALLMFVAYIVAVVFALKNDNKIAKIYAVVYVSLLLITQLNVLFGSLEIVDQLVLADAPAEELALYNNYVMSAAASVFLVLTQLVYFLTSLSSKCEKAVVEESVQEEAPVENVEAVTEE